MENDGSDGSGGTVTGTTNVIQTISDITAMIDIHAAHLEGLRTQCSTSADLIQQEIRTIEGKLVKLFSRQLVAKQQLPVSELTQDLKCTPSLEQWLKVVGISEACTKELGRKFVTLESLQELSDHEIKQAFTESGAKDEEFRRMVRALQNLRKYTEVLLQAEKQETRGRTTPDFTLYWDSWDNASTSSSSSGVTPPQSSFYASQSSLSPSLQSQPTPLVNNFAPSSERLVPTSPLIRAKGDRSKFPATPPPHKKNIVQGAPLGSPTEFQAVQKLKPFDSPAASRNDVMDSPSLLLTRSRRGRPSNAFWLGRSMETLSSGHGKKLSSVSDASVSAFDVNPLRPQHGAVDYDERIQAHPTNVAMSKLATRTQAYVMGHVIKHRFTKSFKMLTTCDFCHKQMFIGRKCKDCKYKCHRDCEPKVPPSCKLPPGYTDFYKEQHFGQFYPEGSQTPNLQRSVGSSMTFAPSPFSRMKQNDRNKSLTQPEIHVTGGGATLSSMGLFDSSSNTSSCSSSTPSSPALLFNPHNVSVNQTPPSGTYLRQFDFSNVYDDDRAQSVEVLTQLPAQSSAKSSSANLANTAATLATVASSGSITSNQPTADFAASQRSQDSDKTVSVSGLSGTSGSNSTSTDSERTYRVDSQDSQVSDTEVGQGDRLWPRQNSLSLREWDIPFDELQLGEAIGQGRFGTVHRGSWHGDVAIRLLSMGQLDDEKILEAFKLEVATFRKTRHENLVLFMGACMKLPSLALVTSMCKGLTLYTHLHLRKDRFSMNKNIIISQQVSQGMGYLHARGIVHKDLKSRNIFLENGKVVITDFGLFSVSKLCKNNGRSDALSIPPGWLCYLSPEIMRSLKPSSEDNDELPFSVASDVYAFGTVWYELLCGEFPYKEQPPEAMIWQIGHGMKQSLANLQASRDLKDILMTCWAYKPEDRPEFSKLLKILERLPKKRLARSPSHPIHLSRSAESVF